MPTWRPEIKGSRHAVSTGHYFASQAAFQVLEAGGNAIDAGACAGIALGILQSDLVSIGGVAPIIIRLASGEIVTVSGLGWWPKAASSEYFRRHHGGEIPNGVLRTVVPSAPDAWITVLERWGTMSFGDVAAAAIRFARDGFPVNPLLRGTITTYREEYERFPSTRALFMPGGQPPEVGALFRQTEAAASLQYMVDQEKAAAGRGREAGLQAARDAFYKGDIARKIVAYQEQEGGWLTMEDMAGFRVGIEAPVSSRFGDVDVYACGAWCQGPCLPQALNLVERFDLRGMGHNSPEYLHVLTETIKLVMADRDAYFGDPRFVDVPLEGLLAKDYAAKRAAMIDPDRAWPELPPAGLPQELGVGPGRGAHARPEPATVMGSGGALDTTYLCVADEAGNVFSATPSDGSFHGPIVPGVGFVASCRGNQSWTEPGHPSELEPGKRPRLTPNPAIAVQRGADGDRFMPLGTPGGDVQTQAMLQVFLNVFVWGMEPQEAVEQPRFASYSFPSSFEPHDYHPGLLKLEGRIGESTGAALTGLGHRVEWWPEMTWLAGSICTIVDDRGKGMKTAGADPRRMGYALAW